MLQLTGFLDLSVTQFSNRPGPVQSNGVPRPVPEFRSSQVEVVERRESTSVPLLTKKGVEVYKTKVRKRFVTRKTTTYGCCFFKKKNEDRFNCFNCYLLFPSKE